MALRSRKRRKPSPVRFTAADFAHPDTTRARLMGMAGGVGAIAAISGLLYLMPDRQLWMTVWGAWVVLALAYYSTVSDQRELRQARVTGRSTRYMVPQSLGDMVSNLARAAGVHARIAPTRHGDAVATVRNTILLPVTLWQRLSPAELQALAGREIGHIKAGNVALRSLCRRLEAEQSPLRLLAVPLLPLAGALSSWRLYADLSADRMALILTRDRRSLAAALLKQALAPDGGVSDTAIDEYLGREFGVSSNRAEVIMHFKLRDVLQARGDLLQRLRAIGLYLDSQEYRDACAKLDGAQHRRDDAQGGTSTAAPR